MGRGVVEPRRGKSLRKRICGRYKRLRTRICGRRSRGRAGPRRGKSLRKRICGRYKRLRTRICGRRSRGRAGPRQRKSLSERICGCYKSLRKRICGRRSRGGAGQLNSRIPLVHASSELVVHRRGKLQAYEGPPGRSAVKQTHLAATTSAGRPLLGPTPAEPILFPKCRIYFADFP
jgi:hypothetical protein